MKTDTPKIKEIDHIEFAKKIIAKGIELELRKEAKNTETHEHETVAK